VRDLLDRRKKKRKSWLVHKTERQKKKKRGKFEPQLHHCRCTVFTSDPTAQPCCAASCCLNHGPVPTFRRRPPFFGLQPSTSTIRRLLRSSKPSTSIFTSGSPWPVASSVSGGAVQGGRRIWRRRRVFGYG
jgi:hypothetical protein